jgi:FtsZ-interacting cell division protein ZipA
VKALVIIIVVLAVLIGGLFTLRSTRSAGMPNKDVMDRAKERERQQAAKDEKEQ